MFDLGSGDKEKLEENMEEIKKLVNEGNQGNQEETLEDEIEPEFNQEQETESFQTDNTNQFKDNLQQGQNSLNQSQNNQQPVSQQPIQDNQNMEEQPIQDNQNIQEQPVQDSMNAEEGSNDVTLDREFQEMQEELRNEITSIKNQQDLHQSQRQHKTQQERQESVEEEISAEPNLEENPLFLEVDRFEEIKNMVEEMHYLTNEMNDVMQHLEAGIQEDQETSTEAQQIIQEFEARREKIQRTLKNN